MTVKPSRSASARSTTRIAPFSKTCTGSVGSGGSGSGGGAAAAGAGAAERGAGGGSSAWQQETSATIHRTSTFMPEDNLQYRSRSVTFSEGQWFQGVARSGTQETV